MPPTTAVAVVDETWSGDAPLILNRGKAWFPSFVQAGLAVDCRAFRPVVMTQ